MTYEVIILYLLHMPLYCISNFYKTRESTKMVKQNLGCSFHFSRFFFIVLITLIFYLFINKLMRYFFTGIGAGATSLI